MSSSTSGDGDVIHGGDVFNLVREDGRDVIHVVQDDGRDVVFLMEDDGSVVSTEQRLYLHRQMTKLDIPPGVLYLPEIVADGVRVTLRSLTCIRDIANPLCLVGQSEGLVCVSDQFAHVFYVLDAGNDRIVREVPERYDDREGFWGQATYGFGHSCRGFKIIRFPYPLRAFREEDPYQPEPIPDHLPTILHIYHSSTGSWTEGMYDLAICDPFREPAFRSPLYGLLFWKVNAAEAVRILAYDLTDDSLYDIAGGGSFVDIPDDADGDDLLRSITFGLGSGGEIIGARFTRRPVEGGQVPLFDVRSCQIQLFHLRLDEDQRWRIDLHSDFQLTLPQDITMPPEPSLRSDITLLTPLIGLGRDDHLQSLFFLVLEDKIICIDFRYNGIRWEPLTKFILEGPTPKFTAICLGPIIIPPESHSSPASGSLSLEESKEATRDQSSKNTGPSRSRESGDSNNAKSDSHDSFNVPNQVSRQPFSSKAQADYEGNPLERTRTEKLCLYGEVERTKDCRVGSPLRQGVSQKGQVPGASAHNSDDLSLKKAYIGVEDVTDGAKKLSRYGKDKSTKNIRPSSTMESDDSSNSKSNSHDSFNVPSQVSRLPFSSKAQADYEGNHLERTCTEKFFLYGEEDRTKDRRVGSPLRQGVYQKGQVPGVYMRNSDDLSLKKAYSVIEDVTDGAKKLSRYGKDKSSKNTRPSSMMESDDSSNSKSDSHDSFNVPSQVSRLPFSLKAQADYEGNHLKHTRAKKLTKGGKENHTIERDKQSGFRGHG